jgi:hypothetical protein
MAEEPTFLHTMPADFGDRLREFAAMPIEQVQAVNAWFRDNLATLGDYSADDFVLEISNAVGLRRPLATQVMYLVLIFGRFAQGKVKETLLADFRRLSLGEEGLRKFEALIDGLDFDRVPYPLAMLEAVTAIPTVVDVNVLCDVRLVFTPPESKIDVEAAIPEPRDFMPILVLSLDIREESNKIQSVVVQFSPRSFERFRNEIANGALKLQGAKAILDKLREDRHRSKLKKTKPGQKDR